jgi:predicted nucleic acid-binding protein
MLSVPRSYADTSVFGGVFDAEFAEPSRAFFDLVRRGRLRLVVSAIVQQEIDHSPREVQELLAEVAPLAEIVAITEAAARLRQEYLNAGIVTPRSTLDALHVALATVSGCELIVSWNFKHIVHYQRIPMYNAVNTQQGYLPLAIHSPAEVRSDEEEDI